MAGIGNAWHIPINSHPSGQESMRFPVEGIDAEIAVTLSSGNQFKGSGTTGNQTQSGSALMIRKVGDAGWSALPVHFHSAQGNDKFFFSTIPANTFHAGELVQYYFKIDYTDRDTTFVHGTNSKSFATANEAIAKAEPFSYAVRYPLEPKGPFLSFNVGPYQARIFQDTGHLAIVGPNLAGTPEATVVTLASPVIESGDRLFQFGRVLSSVVLADGLEVTQQLGTGQIRAELTLPFEGVMRYEVVDWSGLAPDWISISAPSNGEEHFYGFGEKFNALDQAGKVVDILTFDNPGNKGDRSYKVAPWFMSTRGYGFHLELDGEKLV